MDEKATQLHAIASLKVLLDATKPQDGANGNATGGQGDGAMGDNAMDSGRASQGTEVKENPLRRQKISSNFFSENYRQAAPRQMNLNCAQYQSNRISFF